MPVLLGERATHYVFDAWELLTDAALVGAMIYVMLRIFRRLDGAHRER